MPNLNAKIKSDLMYLYELNEFKSFKKFLDAKRNKIALILLNLDMSVAGNDKNVTLLQGQAKALEWIQLELKNIHKKEVAKATAGKD